MTSIGSDRLCFAIFATLESGFFLVPQTCEEIDDVVGETGIEAVKENTAAADDDEMKTPSVRSGQETDRVDR